MCLLWIPVSSSTGFAVEHSYGLGMTVKTTVEASKAGSFHRAPLPGLCAPSSFFSLFYDLATPVRITSEQPPFAFHIVVWYVLSERTPSLPREPHHCHSNSPLPIGWAFCFLDDVSSTTSSLDSSSSRSSTGCSSSLSSELTTASSDEGTAFPSSSKVTRRTILDS